VGDLASFVQGPVAVAVAENNSVGTALLVGFAVCVFSFIVVWLLVWLDWWAAKKDGVSAELGEDEKFKWSDLRQLKGRAYWLLTISCIFGYMSIDGYSAYSADMLDTRFGFSDDLAATIYTVPSMVSIIVSPTIGFIVDRYGRRVRISKCLTPRSNSCPCLCQFFSRCFVSSCHRPQRW